jgi:exodeoxyribonuclease-5
MTDLFTPEQEAATGRFMQFLADPNEPELIIDGGPGVGKTFLTSSLIQLAKDNAPIIALLTQTNEQLEINACATTHKACAVLGEALGASQEVSTLHSTLGLSLYDNYRTGKTSVTRNKDFKLTKNTVLIVDEYSPVDSVLLEYVRASCVNCKTLFIGDHGQLLGANQTNSAVYNAGIPTFNLTNPVRFNGAPGIRDLVYQLREVVHSGKFTDIVPNGIDVLHLDGPSFQKAVETEFGRPNYVPDDARAICWSNNRVHEYNNFIHKFRTGRDDIVIGDLLISNKNHLHSGLSLGNEKCVRIVDIGPPTTVLGVEGRYILTNLSSTKWLFLPNDLGAVSTAMKHFSQLQNWDSYFQIKNEFGDLRPPYAQTCHKAQGSTYKRVYIDLSDIGKCNSPYDVSRMIYVAASRATQQVIFYGELPRKYKGGAWFPIQ